MKVVSSKADVQPVEAILETVEAKKLIRMNKKKKITLNRRKPLQHKDKVASMKRMSRVI